MGFRSFRIAFALGLIAGSGVSISACSSDDEEPQGKAGTGAGATGGAGGSSGRGGSAGTGAGGSSGTGATGGAGGTGGMGSITCGTRTCQPGGLGFIPACCIDNERCGIDPPQLTLDGGDLPCTEVGQPGTPDPTCFAGQGIDLEDAGIDAAGIVDGGRLTIPGCCRPNGMCGIIIDVPQIGLNLGCIDPEAYGAIYDAGPPQRCGDGGGGHDASIDSGTGDSSTEDSSTGDSTAD